ncbi:hypothetical protein A9P82_14670 [Arachidicoccus ginsenosidimutans]|uniref:5-oxoprolinase subunit PxpB n=1 Tax=Arachidicoccus sp. BS20 TaxID=1850526 RepID=UPI0007F0BE38|nr:5-oxoprolinase subunit PxpB [Arachidicoccus sp. BS20]ANI90419.1 hypothetical protein A9P82_14670 [Arachidicoccus sp. BS20]
MTPEYIIQSLGDDALIVDFGKLPLVDAHFEVTRLNRKIQAGLSHEIVETVAAYTTLAIFYRLDVVLKNNRRKKNETAFYYVKNKVEQLLQEKDKAVLKAEERLIKIPVCYDEIFAPDLKNLSIKKEMTVDKIIAIHSSKVYNVYMIGFLPGFPYLGEVDDAIAFERKKQPVNVAEGSVGIAGKQTGIYPVGSPGGWQIIGRTPVKIFDPQNEEPCFLKAGDKIQFYSISKNEFENYQSRNT